MVRDLKRSHDRTPRTYINDVNVRIGVFSETSLLDVLKNITLIYHSHTFVVGVFLTFHASADCQIQPKNKTILARGYYRNAADALEESSGNPNAVDTLSLRGTVQTERRMTSSYREIISKYTLVNAQPCYRDSRCYTPSGLRSAASSSPQDTLLTQGRQDRAWQPYCGALDGLEVSGKFAETRYNCSRYGSTALIRTSGLLIS